MEETQFFLIALRVGQNCVRGKRVLKESVPFYFCQGYTISKDGERIHVDDDKCLDERVYNDYLKERAGNNRITLQQVCLANRLQIIIRLTCTILTRWKVNCITCLENTPIG